MERRRAAPRDWQDDERRPKRRRKVKKNGGSLLWVFVVLGVLTLAGIGGVVVFLVSRERTGDGRSPDRHSAPEDMGERFVGKWEGGSPERPSVHVYLEVTPDRVILQGQNIRTQEWGGKLVYSWKPVRASGNTLTISRQPVAGEKRDLQWSIRFASEDEMSVTSLVDNRLIANFKRVGKRITKRDREEAAGRNSARIIGKWSVPTFESIKLRRGILEFAEGGKAIFTIDRNRIGERPDTGSWQVLEAEDNKLKLEIRGIEDFEILHIELRSDKEMALSMGSKAGFSGVQLSATRVP
jgi:hypothetical protein